jgi:hypothetical protein
VVGQPQDDTTGHHGVLQVPLKRGSRLTLLTGVVVEVDVMRV